MASHWNRILPLGALVLAVACDGGGAGQQTAPLAAKEPRDILAHLQYLAAKKDYQHLVLIAPAEPVVLFPSARWFHIQAKQLGIELTDEEMKNLKVDGFKDKLDALPPAPAPGYDSTEARAAFYAGLYRLIKGFSPEEWNEMRVMEVRQNPANLRIMDVSLGKGGTIMMKVACVQKADKAWGIANIEYKVGLKKPVK